MVGDILRAERENKGLSIKDIERETSIRALYIEAIENSDFDSLPSEVYVRGFVKNYANFLQLNTDYIMQQYREEHPSLVQNQADSVPETSQQSRGEMFSSGNDFKERVHKSHRGQNIMVVIGLIVCAFVGSIYYFFGEDTSAKPATVAKVAEKQPEPVKKTAEKKPADDKKTVKNVDDKNKDADKKVDAKATEKTDIKQDEKKAVETEKTATVSAPAAGAVNVGAVFSDYCWAQVIVDGKTVFEGTADKGQSFEWAANERIFVLIGNAGAVELTQDGRSLGKAGKIGEVVEKTFTAPRTTVQKKR